MRTVSVAGGLFRFALFITLFAGVYIFGSDEASAEDFRRCATEGGICNLPYPTEVMYGNGRRVTSRFINRPQVRCSNSVFGDPARGRAKSCSYAIRKDMERGSGRFDGYRDRDRYDRNRQWQPCAREGQYCDFRGRKRVRYGTQHRYVERVFRGGVRCDNRTFGDPDRGSAKRCFVLE